MRRDPPRAVSVSDPCAFRTSRCDGSVCAAAAPVPVPGASFCHVTGRPVHHAAQRHGTPADQFITLLSGTAVGLPLAAGAQQAGRTYRLGVLHNLGPQSPRFPPFYDELRRLGFVEGQNLIVDTRRYAVRTEQFPAVSAELVRAPGRTVRARTWAWHAPREHTVRRSRECPAG